MGEVEAGRTSADRSAGTAHRAQNRVSLKQLAVVVMVPLLLCAAVVAAVPFSQPMPSYWTDALELARTGVISQRFTPSGYPLTIALGAWAFSSHPAVGVMAEQALLHLVLCLVLWGVMRRLRASPRAALVATLLLAADPELLLSVTKIWDVAFSTLLMLAIVLCSLRIVQRGLSVGGAAALGVVWAFGCFDRPNYVSLLPGIALAMWWGAARPWRSAGPRRTWEAVFATLAAACVYIGCSLLAYHAVRTPGNGPYNLFAGNNQYSREALLTKLNGEPSIAPALAADGVEMRGREPGDLSLRGFYDRSSESFALRHPGAEMELAGVKLFTLLRPDTKVHRLGSAAGAVKGLLALFVPAWVVIVLWFWRVRRRIWTMEDSLVTVLAVLYVLPFLLTNADPRFRTPLDVMAAAHAVSLLWRQRV